MKKFFLMFTVLLMICMLLPVQVHADNDKIYQVDSASFVIDLQPDGSAAVTESWTVTYISGEFHRFYKDIHTDISKIEAF